jgi:hypothetical protein
MTMSPKVIVTTRHQHQREQRSAARLAPVLHRKILHRLLRRAHQSDLHNEHGHGPLERVGVVREIARAFEQTEVLGQPGGFDGREESADPAEMRHAEDGDEQRHRHHDEPLHEVGRHDRPFAPGRGVEKNHHAQHGDGEMDRQTEGGGGEDG